MSMIRSVANIIKVIKRLWTFFSVATLIEINYQSLALNSVTLIVDVKVQNWKLANLATLIQLIVIFAYHVLMSNQSFGCIRMDGVYINGSRMTKKLWLVGRVGHPTTDYEDRAAGRKKWALFYPIWIYYSTFFKLLNCISLFSNDFSIGWSCQTTLSLYVFFVREIFSLL